MVGGDLLNSDSRVNELLAESEIMHKMSAKRLKAANKLSQQQTGAESHQIDIGKKTTRRQVVASDMLLRWALKRDAEGSPRSMRVHVIGYSLGGFVAQSVFFAWPQVVSSCTTICSGGALSALSPTAFAQPEEWQSVLHSLRPELSNSMLQGRLGSDEGKKDVPVGMVAGMPIQRFGYFQRIFEQVFLQEDRSSYQERLSEYGLRMLFVSGGEDPIVPPKNILDASPKEGTTMLSIAGMTHFLNQEPRKDRIREIEQRDFWLPEAGRLIARAAIHSERVQRDEREVAGELNSQPASKTRSAARTGRPGGSNLLTDSGMFEAAMDGVIDAVKDKGGWLIACRNTLPAALVGQQGLIRWGMALHHHDVRIQQYVAGLRHRAWTLEGAAHRTTLILPEQLKHWFVDLSARFDPHSDGPMGRMTTREDREEIWGDFEKNWRKNIRQFEAGSIAQPLEDMDVSNFAAAIARWQEVEGRFMEVTHLPDVWIGIQEEGKLISTNSRRSTDIHSQIIGGVERLVEEEVQRALLHLELELRKDQEGLENLEHHKKQLEDDIKTEKIRVVQVSGAEFNPRYRGKIEISPSVVMRMLAWCAAGLVRSKRMDVSPEQAGEESGS
jgi:pimeloyl-ACP methyl ester carboxylesterase